MRPYTTHQGRKTILKTDSGKELHIIDDRHPNRTVIQICGERGGLHGTIRVQTRDLREALRQAGICP